MYSEAQKRATMKYNNANYKSFMLRLRFDTDKEIIDWLDKQDSYNAAVKRVLEEYIKKDLK